VKKKQKSKKKKCTIDYYYNSQYIGCDEQWIPQTF
jgi:hypothetical protein